MNKTLQKIKTLRSKAKAPAFSSFSSVSFVRFSTKEQTLFAKRMSFLVKAGVPIVECLHLIRKQTKSKGKIKIYDAIIDDVSNGQYLATSLGKHKRLFGEFAVNLIKVGESSGILSQNLAYLADELHKKQLLTRKVIGTLIYPIFITIATLGVTGLLTVYIFPKLMPLFTGLGITLPLTTRVLIAVSEYLRHWGLLTIAIIAVLVGIFLLIRNKQERVRYWGDNVLLRVPLAGSLVRSYNLANFCRTMGLLLKSGVHLTEATAIVSQTTKNRVFREACAQAGENVIKGERLSRSLESRPDVYPDLLAHMVAIGESTGNLSSTFMYLAELYENEVDELSKSLSSSIEPVLMVVMGLLVGLIAVSVITPIYEITQHLSPK